MPARSQHKHLPRANSQAQVGQTRPHATQARPSAIVTTFAFSWIVLMTITGVVAETSGLVRNRPKSGRYVQTELGFMVPYTQTIPGTQVKFEMIPVPAGKFKMGSPADEHGRAEAEGPQINVSVEPFWMGKYEVTWAEYKEFMALYAVFKRFDALNLRQVGEDNKADAVTIPTPIYDSNSIAPFGMELNHPAVTMTQYAACQYTKWLSKLTACFYRLPTEAEWEYACRAGSQTAYSFGGDPKKLGEYAWYLENAVIAGTDSARCHAVGLMKPNAWGLYDMHGNAREWVMDQLRHDWFERFKGGIHNVSEVICWPTDMKSHVLKGGSFVDDPEACRSAARNGSDHKKYYLYCVDSPPSPWWYTGNDAEDEVLTIGFRIIRPLKEPDMAIQARYWETDVESVHEDVRKRLIQGRGAQGVVDPTLPGAVEKLRSGE